jgi:hypothetical protein
LEKKISAREWSFIKIAEGVQASGVGETSQEAISSALRLALLRMSVQFNAVEVEHIELSQYPWFIQARLRVCQYRIQQGAVLLSPMNFRLLPLLLERGDCRLMQMFCIRISAAACP